MEPNAEPAFATPTVYGRACSACARAKAKCVTGNGFGAKCQRCLRLNKDCQPLQTVRKRRTGNRPSANRTELLEEKLDGLYKLLNSSTSSTSIAGQNGTISTAEPSIQPSPESFQSLGPSPENCEDFGPCSIQRLGWNQHTIDGLRLHSPNTDPDSSYLSSGTRSTIYHSPKNSLISGVEPSSDEAEECLNIFRTHMMTYFPFIIIPGSSTAHELRHDRPFLWTCIMSISSKSSLQQVALGKEVRITMGREILVEGKNNLDLLLGILTFIAWGHYQVHDKPVITQVTQLAVALVAHLGLNKPPLKEPAKMMLNLDGRGCLTKPFNLSTRTMEERRAVLGCFLLSSVVSSYFQRVDALRWTSYLDECVTVLAETGEHPSDILLIQLVKLQLISEKVGQAPWNDGYGDATGSTAAAPTFYLKALQAQLQDLKVKIPHEIQRNNLLLLYLYHTELRIHEIAFCKVPVVFNSHGFPRLDSLYACLHATKSWFDLFITLPSASYVGFSIPILTQMAHCIVALFRLLTFDDPTWDRGLARDTANLSLILGQIIDRLIQVKVVARLDPGVSEDKDIFNVTSRNLVSIKAWWDAKLAAESTVHITLDETLGETSVDFADDVWLKDILGQGDYPFDLNMQWQSAGSEV